MAYFRYIFLRIIRHFMPDGVARWLLKRRLFIKPGLETSSPEDAIRQYLTALEENQVTFAGKRILILGYGGRFAVACGLLQAGAAQVILSDPFARPDDRANKGLLPQYSAYLIQEGGRVVPRPGRMNLLQDDIRSTRSEPVDLVLSNSVFEHVDDVVGIVEVLAQLTRPDGAQLHFIDLRDHYFKFPFEMLTFTEKTWKWWLNPTSNLNRLRYRDYELIFQEYFEDVKITIRASQVEDWNKIYRYILPEFISGNPEKDAATLIQVAARRPRGYG